MSVPSQVTLYPSNDQVVEVTGLQNNISGAYLNSATVTATLKDSTGQAVTGLNGLALAYITSSNGNYRGQVEETFAPAIDNYTLHIDANQSGLVLHLEIPAVVKARNS